LQSANPFIASEKAALRREMSARLRSLTALERTAKSRAICRAIVESPKYRNARVAALFAAMPSEPDLSDLSESTDKTFAFPRVEGDEVKFYAPPPAGPWGVGSGKVREPDPAHSTPVPAMEIDLILVPGLAFTSRGERLGRGGGYYDRLLARISAEVPRIGVAFACQIVERLPIEPHDAAVDCVVSEDGWSL
jgi:5-formyltetrahydrofolate cyclo-ligase